MVFTGFPIGLRLTHSGDPSWHQLAVTLIVMLTVGTQCLKHPLAEGSVPVHQPDATAYPSNIPDRNRTCI